MTGPPLRILAFEPFDGGSHRAVRESISRHSRHRWRWVTRPARAWKWRMRLAAIELVDRARNEAALAPPIDLVLATSLLSAGDLRAALVKAGVTTPLVLYMHENQAAYPHGPETAPIARRDVQLALTNLTSVLTADRVIWNSRFNLDSFLEGIGRVLDHARDTTLTGWRRRIEAASEVIWPPVEPPPPEIDIERPHTGALHNSARVVWPHRWEHDKGPEELLELAGRLSATLGLRWTILGQRFAKVPPALETFRERLAGRIDHMGFIEDRGAYLRHLARCDWVLSTARHEFFGVAVVEAMMAGCLPWLPDRLSYPELLPEIARGLSPARPVEDPAAVRSRIAAHLRPAHASNAVARMDEAMERAAG
jgi:glycosyltransferase involved in cell wall biosynthesis